MTDEPRYQAHSDEESAAIRSRSIKLGPLYPHTLDNPRYECRPGLPSDLFECAGCQAKREDGLI